MTQAAGDARALFQKLGKMRESLGAGSMAPVLERAGGMSASESEKAVETLDHARDAYGEASLLLAEKGGADFAELREQPAMRAAVTDSKRPLESDSFFGPLLRCFDQRIRSSDRAELLTKMELYIESGHARRDCFGAQAEGASKAAADMRELFESGSAAAPAGASTKEAKAAAEKVRRTIEARFDELFIRMRVRKEANGFGEDFAIELAGKNGARISKKVSGLVDAAIRDADDPSILRCGIATASNDTAIEGDQVLRHGRALARAVSEGVFEGSAATSGIARVDLSFHSPTSLYSSHDESRGARSALGDGMTKKTKDRLVPAEREAINAIPYLSVFNRFGPGSGSLRAGLLADVELRLFGAAQPVWNGAMERARALPAGSGRDRFVVAAAAERLGAAIDAFSKLSADPGELLTTNDFMKTSLTSFADALKGVTRHGLAHPEDLAPIQRRLGSLRELRSKIEEGSPLRGELGEVASRYGRPGGIAAWASEFKSEEALSDARLFTRNAARAADIKATLDFVEQFSAARPDSSTLSNLSADVKADGWAAEGFDAKEAAKVSASLAARAEKARLNEQYLSAAARGDKQTAFDAVRRGADPEAVDPKGYGASELCWSSGHVEAAKALDRMITGTIDEKVRARVKVAEESVMRP